MLFYFAEVYPMIGVVFTPLEILLIWAFAFFDMLLKASDWNGVGLIKGAHYVHGIIILKI